MSTVDELHERWSRQADYREAYEELEPEYTVARALIEARTRAGFSQAELAARMESGRTRPSTRTLEKVARATGTRLRIHFEPE